MEGVVISKGVVRIKKMCLDCVIGTFGTRDVLQTFGCRSEPYNFYLKNIFIYGSGSNDPQKIANHITKAFAVFHV